MRPRARCGTLGALAAIVWPLAVPAALAQDVRVTAPAPSYAAGPADNPELKPLTPEESDVLGRALLFDPADRHRQQDADTASPASLTQAGGLDVKRDDKPDGSSTVAVKKPVAPGLASTGLDANVGADVNLAAPPPSVFQPGKPLPGAAPNDTGSAAAWASLGVANLASLDARVDPANDRGKIGGTLKHSVPVGKKFSVTLEDSYSMTETLGPAAAAPTVSSPAAPVPVTAPPPGPTQVFDNSKSVKFNIAPTGTTFGAGMTTASNDPVTHNTLSADQKLFGPLHVTTAVTDVGQPSESKSITARFKLNW